MPGLLDRGLRQLHSRLRPQLSMYPSSHAALATGRGQDASTSAGTRDGEPLSPSRGFSLGRRPPGIAGMTSGAQAISAITWEVMRCRSDFQDADSSVVPPR